MTSSQPNSGALSSLRTYANDLNAVREKNGSLSTTKTVTQTEKSTEPEKGAVYPPIQQIKPAEPTAIKHTLSKTDPVAVSELTSQKNTSQDKKDLPTTPVKLTSTSSRDASYDAHIITDTKHKRFKLVPAIKDAVANWFDQHKQKINDQKKPTYTIPNVEHRKGIVEKATSVTARTATQDHASVVARLKAEKEARVAKITSSGTTQISTNPKPLSSPIWDTAITTNPVSEKLMDSAHSLSLDVPKESQAESKINVDSEITKITPTKTETEAPLPTPVSSLNVAPIITTVINQNENVLSDSLNKKAYNKFITNTGQDSVLQQKEPLLKTVPISNVVVTQKIKPLIPRTDIKNIPATVIENELEIEETEDDYPDLVEVNEPIEQEQEDNYTTKEKEFVPIIPKRITPERIMPIIPVKSETEKIETAIAPRTVEDIPPVLSSSSLNTKQAIAARKETLEKNINTYQKPRNFSIGRFLPHVVISLFGLISVSVIGYFLISNSKTTPINSPIETDKTNTDSISQNNVSSPITVVSTQLETETRVGLLKALELSNATTESFVTIIPVNKETGIGLNNKEILLLLNRQLNPDFIGETVSVVTGNYRSAPVIVIATNNYETAKGSMFAWERTMKNDFSLWLSKNSVIDQKNNALSFSDVTISNQDVRLIKNENGEILILYAVTTKGNVIITTTELALINLLSKYGTY